MKAVFKSMATGLAVVLILSIVFVTVIANSRQTVIANESFNGIDTIITSNTKNNPFKILEVVPDSSMGELGYMISGQEPEHWLTELAGYTSKESRTEYVTGLKTKLTAISGTDTTNALKYEDYEETYAPGDKSEWNTLYLSSQETIAKGTSGYSMTNVGAGYGEFKLDHAYLPSSDKTGTYNQNVDYYIYSGAGYYEVSFKEVATTIDDNGKVTCSASTIYQAVDKTYLDESNFEQLKANKPNAYIYYLNTSDYSGAYNVYTQSDKPVQIKDIEYSTLDADESKIFYSVEFEYVSDMDSLVSTEHYYVSDYMEFFSDGAAGEYGAKLNDSEPYVAAASGNFTPDPSNDCYVYAGEGLGTYNLVASGTLSDYPVKVDRTYYKGGFTNNNLFRNGVFNQDEYFDENANSNMYFDVDTVVPEELDSISVADYDLIYIAGNSSINGQVKDFGSDNDISWETLSTFISKVQSGLPVIADYSIIGTGASDLANSTNMQKLTALLCADSLYDISLSNEDESSSDFWNGITLNTDADHHFVNGNVYVYPGNEYDASDKKAPYLFSKFASNMVSSTSSTTSFENEAESIGFGEIAEYIDNQNLSRKTENDALGGDIYGYFDLSVSKAIAVEYIICYSDMETIEVSDSISVLDIEPCYVDDTTTDAIQSATILKWFSDKGYNISEVNVTHMSTAEFIGKVQDLTAYDMIYFGLSTNKFNKINNKTVYNDSNMNGLIYSNVGDICVVTTDHAGLLNTDYYYDGLGNRTGVKPLDEYAKVWNQTTYANANNTYRYSGNDITEENKSSIQDYIKAGCPVVINDGFFTKDSSGNYVVNGDYIDNCSVMYELMDGILEDSNVMRVSQATKKISTLYGYLMLGKPSINYEEPAKEKDTDYVKLSDNKISIDFSISNQGSAEASSTFDVKLYLDINADGKFSKTQEVIGANDTKIYDNGTYIKPESYTDDSGSKNYYYQLSSGSKHSYQLIYTLPDGYVGIIPWKMVVSQSTNSYRFDSVSGYVYREHTEDVETIKVLQINHSNNSKSTFNMQAQLADTSSKFYKLMQEVEDFNIDITTVDSVTFGNNYKDGYLDQFDMLVIGFADCYQIADNNGCIAGIQDYINDGKPVLFTHDTTSLYNNSTNTAAWGYYFNTQVRNLVGLDRYGILSSSALQEGLRLVKGSSDTGDLYNEAVEYASENGTDLAYEPKSNKSVIVKQNQGMAYGDLVRFAVTADAGLNSWNRYNSYYYLTNTTKNGSFQMRTTKVAQVNSGQITTYPFIIPEEFTVSQTHSQYYQINMNEDEDGDGESDIVVWYTLEGNDSTYKNIVYGASPKDVRNNYYIYTKGNVTYSGVGHSSIANNENELKLYINTMVAAYSAGAHAPSISLKETSDDDSADLGTIYESFEQELDDGTVSYSDKSLEQEVAGDDTAVESIYFSVTDSNIVRNLKRKEIRIDFGIPADITEEEYNKNPDDYLAISTSGDTVTYLKKIDVDLYNLDGDAQITYLNSGVTYRADIPLDVLPSDSNSVEVYAVAYTKIIKYKSDKTEADPITTANSFDSFTIQRIGLSDLD